MKPHSFINSDPAGWDSNCAICGGKHRDSIHGATEEIRKQKAQEAVQSPLALAVAQLTQEARTP
jgi:hypothetical protein